MRLSRLEALDALADLGKPTPSCNVCAADELVRLAVLPRVPIDANYLWPTAHEARSAERGTIDLRFCYRCGHVFNAAFEPERVRYTAEYEISQMFSPRFRAFAETLADHLIEAYHLRQCDVVEIGGGKGDFLRLLCARGDNRGVSVDPAFDAEPDTAGAHGSIRFIRDRYDERHRDLPADLLCCRHTLEHLWDCVGFLDGLRDALGDRKTPLYLEVPNGAYLLREQAVSELVYPHCSYFTPSSLVQLLASCGFVVDYLHESFEGQFLSIGAVPSNMPPSVPRSFAFTDLPNVVSTFRNNWRERTAAWERTLAEIQHGKLRAVAWGAGAKATTFFNILDVGEAIPCIVDVSPRKAGHYVAGTGQLIVEPNYLRSFPPDVVLVMNRAYLDEIRTSVGELGLSPRFEVV